MLRTWAVWVRIPRWPLLKVIEMEELYFCMHLTENEHYFMEDDLHRQCQILGLEMKYYRKLKEGHVPMYREIKIVGPKESVNRLKKYIRDEKYDEQIERNPHKIG